jgi:NADH-quinone oxidoreductase subunit G
MPIADVSALKRVLVIGSFLRKDHPLLTSRLRHAVKQGAKISLLHATDEDLLMPVANKMIKAPSDWLAALGEIVAAVAIAAKVATPAGFEATEISSAAHAIAESLMTGAPAAVFLGNAAAQHPDAAKLHAVAEWIAQNTGARFGYLTEGANTVGGYLAGAIPTQGANALQAFATPRKAYLLLNAEPKLDSANPQDAATALGQAEMVVVMSPFQHGLDYADVMLPIAPYAETSGTFVNAEGRAQSFNGSTKPLGDTRPAWKVLRVLGNLLSIGGFDYETSEAIRNEVLSGDFAARLDNTSGLAPHTAEANADAPLERIADVPIYATDAIVRRAESLQQTADANAPLLTISAQLAERLGLVAGALALVRQGEGSAMLPAAIDARLPANVVRLAAAHIATSTLGAMFGAITVEKA